MINKSLKFIILSFALVGTIQSEIFKMRESPIRTRISSKQLNRISLKNDRIESITGMEEAFQFEKNEKTGDGYIKPTETNGNEPIAISLTTTSGRTQELILNVDEGEPNTIVLENGENSEDLEDFSDNSELSDISSPTSSNYETSITEAMKKLVADDLIPIKLSIKPCKNVPGFKIKYLGSYKAGSFVGEKFEISNNSNVMVDLKEADFWSADDVALSFSDLKICKGRKIILYVLVMT